MARIFQTATIVYTADLIPSMRITPKGIYYFSMRELVLGKATRPLRGAGDISIYLPADYMARAFWFNLQSHFTCPRIGNSQKNY